jgi:hypothetical protein
MGAEKIAGKRWLYTLYKLDDGTIVLSVLCGGVAMYELNIPLDEDRAAKALRDEDFLDSYANAIRGDPQKYADLSIRM